MADERKPRLPDRSRPRLPEQRSRQSESRNAGTFFALFGLGLITFGLIGMVALVMPQAGAIVLVFFGAIGFFAAHYILWGWWLPKLTKKDDDAE